MSSQNVEALVEHEIEVGKVVERLMGLVELQESRIHELEAERDALRKSVDQLADTLKSVHPVGNCICEASPWASVNPAATLADRLGDLPEINFSNYNQGDVEAMNAWAIEAYTLLAATPAQQDETIAQPTDEQILLFAANFMDANSFEHNKAEFVRYFRKLLAEPAPVGEMSLSKAHEFTSMLDVQTLAQLESLARRPYGGRSPVYMSGDDARALLAAPQSSPKPKESK